MLITLILRRAIEQGCVLLLENLGEDMDELVEAVLAAVTFRNQKNELCIKLGDAAVLYNPRFKLFATTRLRNPRFPFTVLRNLCVVNFSITRAQVRCLSYELVAQLDCVSALEACRNNAIELCTG